LLDVDGVLTDGTVSIDSAGGEAKQFFIRDGLGIVWARRLGLEVGVLSGRRSGATSRRAAELGITIVSQDRSDKREGLAAILENHGYEASDVAYMGDDLVDLPVLSRVGLSAAPADAIPEVLARVDWVSRFGGGRGAVRELVELVLLAQNRWDDLHASYQA
jgi:3-deoxy-D-manno-octulosonate 8-phosphate phosphatase (KDO 8-P phosphatase)